MTKYAESFFLIGGMYLLGAIWWRTTSFVHQKGLIICLGRFFLGQRTLGDGEIKIQKVYKDCQEVSINYPNSLLNKNFTIFIYNFLLFYSTIEIDWFFFQLSW